MYLKQIVERPLEDRRWMRRRLHQIIRIPLFLLDGCLPDDVAHERGAPTLDDDVTSGDRWMACHMGDVASS